MDCPWENTLGLKAWLEPEFANHTNEDLQEQYQEELKELGVCEVTDNLRTMDLTCLGAKEHDFSAG